MESKIARSRSVLIDPILKKTIKDSYDIHIRKLSQIEKRKTQFVPNNIDEVLKKNKIVKDAQEKVKHTLDFRHFQNKAMVSHIRQIMDRRISFEDIKHNKNRAMEIEKREIEKQNKILNDKIKESKSQKLTKKDLKKQFLIYESHKNLLRKVKYES